MEYNVIIGFIGVVMMLIGFINIQRGKWEDEDIEYDISNLVGSLFLLWYAYIIKAYPFIVLNLIWSFVSFMDVVKAVRLKKGEKMVSMMDKIEK